MKDLARFIRDIPNFPRKGIIFKDITPLLRNAQAFMQTIDALEERHTGDGIDAIAAVESRGFIFGAALGVRLRSGFIPIRKPGKLPHETLSETYSLEYGTDTIQVHSDAITKGDRILLIDDLLATGGTARGAINLISRMGGVVVGASFVVELAFLGGRVRLESVPTFSLVQYD